MATNLQYYKTITGKKGESILMDTSAGPGIAPTNAIYSNHPLSAEKTTGRIGPTADGFICDPGGANKTYNLGDAMITYSGIDGIKNSAGATMNGFNSADYPAWESGGYQSIIVTRVPDETVTTAGFAASKKGKFFWVFFNCHAYGVQIGVIDMDGDSGKGTFKNKATIGLSVSGELGVLDGTTSAAKNTGVSSRMAAQCAMFDGDEVGVILITHRHNFTSATPSDGWIVHKITVADGTHCAPKIDDASMAPTVSLIGTPLDGMCDDACNGTVSIAPNLSTTDTRLKFATVVHTYAGAFPIAMTSASVEVFTVDTATLVVDTEVIKPINIYDVGPGLANYTGAGSQPRFFGSQCAWSHNSVDAKAFLYYVNLDNTNPLNPKLKLICEELEMANVAVNTLSIPLDTSPTSGINIYEDGRTAGGFWPDPMGSGRLFLHTPRHDSDSASTPGPLMNVWSSRYPDVYGPTPLTNDIQHMIIENVNDPFTTTPDATNTGILDPVTYYTWGSPVHIYCGLPSPPPSSTFYVEKCDYDYSWFIDRDNKLWQCAWGAVTSVVSYISDLNSVTNLVDATAHPYSDIVYIISGTGIALRYDTYDTDTGLLNTGAIFTAGAPLSTYAHIPIWTSAYITKDGAASGSTGPNGITICATLSFLGQNSVTATKYSIGQFTISTSQVQTYQATANEFNLASDFGGVLAALTPEDMAYSMDHDGTNEIWYVCIGKRILKKIGAGAWALLANTNAGLPANITGLTWKPGVAHGTAGVLLGICGPIGAQKTYEVNITTGELTNASTINDYPGGYAWPYDAPVSFIQSARRFWQSAPMKVTAADPGWSAAGTICDGRKFRMEGHMGCFWCDAVAHNPWHVYSDHCTDYLTQPGAQYYDNCLQCVQGTSESCHAFLSCCYDQTDPNAGPMHVVTIHNTSTVVTSGVYHVSSTISGVNYAGCGIEAKPASQLWMSMSDNTIIDVDEVAGNCFVQTIVPGTFNNVTDIAFDRNGNLLVAQNGSDLDWASAWNGYGSSLVNISTTFPTPKALDTDYSFPGNKIVSADNLSGTATFNVYDNPADNAGTLVLSYTRTNATISVGNDISCTPFGSDWYVLGDVTGALAQNDLILIDDATGNHTLIADLATAPKLNLAATELCAGIETWKDPFNTEYHWIVTYIDLGGGQYNINLYQADSAGVIVGSVVNLINPNTATLIWNAIPTGLAYNDICEKWPNNVSTTLSGMFDCAACLSLHPGQCGYKFINCDTGAITWSTDSLTYQPLVGSVIDDSVTGNCLEVHSAIFIGTPIASPNSVASYVDCSTCQGPSIRYYKLVNCNNPGDIVYTDDSATATGTPGIAGWLGQVVQLSGENFCREVSDNPLGPQGTEVTQTIVFGPISHCTDCLFQIELVDCDGVLPNILLDYASSTALHPYIGTADAIQDPLVGGVVQTGCWQVGATIYGPNMTSYPTGALGTVHPDCSDCISSGRTCVQVEHCCGPSYVPNQIIDVTTGITLADIGSVVNANITIMGVVYSGCWTVSADPTAGCVGVLNNIDVTPVHTSTVGSGNYIDCTTCENAMSSTPCPPLCAVIELCSDPTQTLTISGADAALIGNDVVQLQNYTGCWKVCDNSNPIHGIQWFYGDHLGIDFRSGAPVADFNGASDMIAYNTGASNYTWRQSAVHCIQENQTIGGHAFTAGDLMFYSDGRYVYDRTHTLMTLDTAAPFLGNAGNALGDSGFDGREYAAQQCVIIPNEQGPKTGSVWHQYYIISNTCNDGPISWSMIDMTLNGGRGQVLSATANTVLYASSCEFMTVSATPAGPSPSWYLWDREVMTTATDWANNNIRGVKFSAAGIGIPFVALDFPASSTLQTFNPEHRGVGEMIASPCNRFLAVRGYETSVQGPYGPTFALKIYAFPINMNTGVMDGPLGYGPWTGFNGGTFRVIIGTFTGISGGNFAENEYCMSFSPDGEKLFSMFSAYAIPPNPGQVLGEANRPGIRVHDLLQIGINVPVSYLSAPYYKSGVLWYFPDDGSTSGATTGWVEQGNNSGMPANANANPTNWGDVLGIHGAVPNDMTIGPDGRLYIALIAADGVPGVDDNWKVGIGAQAQGAQNTILVLDYPNEMAIAGSDFWDQIDYSSGVMQASPGFPAKPHGIGNRRMGTWFPTWLNSPCPCDPVNIVPITITNTLPSCQDPICLNPAPTCYKITECACTGAAAYNSCAVNDPATMPPNMITWGKSWGALYNGPNGQRYNDIANAIQLLGTQAFPGTNQTVNISYSFMKAGTALDPGIPGSCATAWGCTIQMDSVVNNTGNNSMCVNYNKTYPMNFAAWRAEFVNVFAEIKNVLEGMFNTTCGYGADLTVNFTDLGEESGGATNISSATTMNAGVGGVYTDSNGGTNIGDIRIGYAPTDSACGGWNQGAAFGVLAYARHCSDTAVLGTNRAQPFNAVMIMDSNEDWRAAGNPVTANSFSIKYVAVHELLHVFGFGHDWFCTGDTPVNQGCCDSPPNSGTGSCGCPSTQYQPGCNTALCLTMNSGAVMAASATTLDWVTVLPDVSGANTGLLGPAGIYERRGFCGIYGNSNPTYGCEDGTCLGCNNIIHYTQDASVAPYVGGTIDWDPGDGGGLRCWEVDFENPCPVTTFTTPVTPASGNPTGDCTTCVSGPSADCYELILCSCNTALGAPATILTDTDLSDYCNGFIGNGPFIEIDLWPGACYEINCSVPLPPCSMAAVTVVVTNSYIDCATCCVNNNTCYELCPCQPCLMADNCGGNLDIAALGAPYGGANTIQVLNWISDPVNGVTAQVLNTMKYEFDTGYTQGSGYSAFCKCPGLTNGPDAFFAVLAYWNIQDNAGQQLPGMPQIQYLASAYSWNDILADLIAGGYAVAGDTLNDVITGAAWIAANGTMGGGLAYSSCQCPALANACTVVSDNLAAQVGQVVDLQPFPPPPLTDGVCYEVNTCGPCGASCAAIGSAPISTVYADCPACGSGVTCPCYQLTHCSTSLVTNNVCPNVDLDTAYLTGQTVQINGECYEVQCDTGGCAGGCTPMTVTLPLYASCSSCNGTPTYNYICDTPGSCNCITTAGAGYVDCATMFANEPTCCGATEYECVGTAPNCACTQVPAGTGPNNYPDMATCLAAAGTCCSGIPATYNCILDVGVPSYSCIDPGDGSGSFSGPTALADCNACVAANCTQCYIESWNCITNVSTGVSICQDPGDGTGTWNNTNGGLAACAACNGCTADPTCTGIDPSYNCDCPGVGCYDPGTGAGTYSDINACAAACDCYDPTPGEIEGACVNCFTDIEMQNFLERMAEICGDCNVPFGLTEQETTCDEGCFGNSNIYYVLDMTSTFGGSTLNRLQEVSTFKTNVLVPAFNMIKANYPSYAGHLYILLSNNWNNQFGPCWNYNNSGGAAPGSADAAEQYLQWAMYPLSGNKGANGPGPTPFVGGTLPAAQRALFGSTQVNGVGGAGFDCNAPAYDDSLYRPLIEDIIILPGSYASDGFTQVNPWGDPAGKEGFSDPYHEFEGGDTSAIMVMFQDEVAQGYYTSQFAVNLNNWNTVAGVPDGVCGSPLWTGVPTGQWHYGLGVGNVLTADWKTDYHNFMSLHEFGWDVNGVALPISTSWNVTARYMMYGGSWITPTDTQGGYVDSRRDFHYHLYQAIGGTKGTVSATGHVTCADYIPVPAVFSHQCWAVTDTQIANMYMGASGGGDPTLTTGYKGGSLSEYGFSFYIPDHPIADLTAEMLYGLFEQYLSDC